MPKHTPTDELDTDTQDDFRFARENERHAEHSRRLNSHEARFKRVEDRLDATCEELGSHIIDHGKNFPASPDADEQKGLEVLAKARQVVARLSTPEGLAQRADELLTDPVEVGVVHGHISMGNLAEAAAIIAKAEGRAAKIGDQAQAEAGPLESQLAEHRVLDRLSKLSATVEALSDRLTRLEARPPASALRPSQTVAKASGARRQPSKAVDPRESAEGVLTRAHGVISSPAVIGNISSMVQAGDLDGARRLVEAAELRHDSAVKARERRSL